ncbi:putative tetratricopeptide repeat protein 41 [Lissotriton helveticus]
MSLHTVDRELSSDTTQNELYSYFTKCPPIQPYLCCTPNDFHEEIDYLARHIFPSLNELCRARGTYFKSANLMWPPKNWESHHTSSLKPHSQLLDQQLRLSLDFISNAFPFFICMLGQTYGEFRPQNSGPLPAAYHDDPSLSKVERNLYLAARSGYPWVLQDPSLSFTELEITQASFLKGSPFQYFYFRDFLYIEEKLQNVDDQEKERVLSMYTSESEYEELRIRDLKARIVNKGLPVRFFKGLQELGDLVLKDWSAVIEHLYPANLITGNIGHEHNLERAYHEVFEEKLCKEFVSSEKAVEMFAHLDAFAVNDDIQRETSSSDKKTPSMFCTSLPRSQSVVSDSAILLLSGERGCGKSTLVAHWAKSFKLRHPDISVISYYVGSSSGAGDDVMSFMKHCITELRCQHFGTERGIFTFSEQTADVWEFPLVVEAFFASINLQQCIVVLDGIDELSGVYGLSTQKVKEFSWLPKTLPHNFKLILTTASSHLSFKSLAARSDVHVLKLAPELDEGTRTRILQQHLALPYKEMPQLELDKLFQSKLSALPLQLAAWASELRVCGLSRTESQCMDEYTEAQSVQDLWALVLRRWVEDYGWTCERKQSSKRKKTSSSQKRTDSGMKGWVVDLLCLLSISRYGLAESEIFYLLNALGYRNGYEVTPVHWAAFRSATFKWIQEKPDGLLHFSHWSIRDTVESRLLGVITPVKECSTISFRNPTNQRKTILHQFLVKYFQKQPMTRRIFHELPWHLKMSGNWKDLYDFLSHPGTIALVNKRRRLGDKMKVDLVHYWQVLSAAGYDPAVAYLHRLQDVARAQESFQENGCDLLASNELDMCRLRCFAAEILKDIRKTSGAEELFLSAEALLSKDKLEDPVTIEVLFRIQKGIGDMFNEYGLFSKGIHYLQNARDTLVCLPSEVLNRNPDLLQQKGSLLWHLTKALIAVHPEQHHQLLNEAIRHFDSFAASPFEQATLKLLEGLRAYSTSDFDASECFLKECLNIRRSLYGKSHILVGEAQEYLADVQSHPKNGLDFHKRLAVENYRQVVKIKEETELLKAFSEDKKQLKLSLSTTLYKLGKLLQDPSRPQAKDEARECLQKSLDLRICHLGPDHPWTLDVQCLLKEMTTEGTGSGQRIGTARRRPETSKYRSRPKSTPSSGSPAISCAQKHHAPERKPCLQLVTPPHEAPDNLQGQSSRMSEKEPFPRLTQLALSGAESLGAKESMLSELPSKETLSRSSVSPVSRVCWSALTSASRRCVALGPSSSFESFLSGPHSTVESLCPTSRSELGSSRHIVLHTSAWYHVPGRYPTNLCPLPPKRHQRRKVSQHHRELMA